ncbi:hypothetical protein L209DRAFT_673063 [Thermothelomyces heterothallicus CBS 203.75]
MYRFSQAVQSLSPFLLPSLSLVPEKFLSLAMVAHLRILFDFSIAGERKQDVGNETSNEPFPAITNTKTPTPSEKCNELL